MGFYDNMASLATRQLNDKGKSITYSRVVNSDYDPTSGVPQTPTTSTVKALVADYKHWQIDGKNILAGDKMVYIAGPSLSFEPDPTTDRVTIDGVIHSIVRATKPVDEDVLHILQVRRG